nr:ORF71 [Human gammaherpesvirus 8]
MATYEVLCEVARKLGTDDREMVLFLLNVFIPQPTLAQLIGALRALKEEGRLTFPLLAECLFRAGRRDLLRDLLHLDPRFLERHLAGTMSYFSPYQLTVLHVDGELCARDIRSLIFLSKDTIGSRSTPQTFLHWVYCMENLDLLGPTDVDALMSMLRSLSRVDLQRQVQTLMGLHLSGPSHSQHYRHTP